MSSSIKGLVSDLKRDAERYKELGGWYKNSGFFAGATYRLGQYARKQPAPVRLPLMLQYKMLNAVCRGVLNVHLSQGAKIGPGLCLIHAWNVLIGPVDMGENCLVFHEVTIGSNANSGNAWPTIGKNVDIYVGARVLGKVRIGDDAKVGANCVVTSSVPDGATVVPAAVRMVSAAAVAAFGPRRAPQGDDSVPPPPRKPPG